MEEFGFDSEKRNIKPPFKVPDGYFDRFTDELMAKLPQKEVEIAPKVTLWEKVSPWVYMAAMFVGMALFLRTFVSDKKEVENLNLALQTTPFLQQSISEISEDEFFDIIDDQATRASYYQTLLTDSNY